MKNKTHINDLKVGDKFEDAELYSNSDSKLPLIFNIIGEHIYTITDGASLIVICGDEGNGHGVVLQITLYEDLYNKTPKNITAKKSDKLLSKKAFVQKGALAKMANGYVNDATIEAIASAWETINKIN